MGIEGLVESNAVIRGLRDRRLGAEGPVFNREISDSPKLLGIVRNQRHANAPRVCGNKQVICAYQLAASLEIGTYFCVVRRCLIGEIEHLDIPEEGIERCLILLPVGRDFHPV